MLPNSDFTLAAGAAGDYDSHWVSFGNVLKDNGAANLILRLGHEFNGKFYPWSAVGKEANFVTYWRRIVDILRAVPGQKFLFEWCPLGGVANTDPALCYPGNDYVDYIGLDQYDVISVPDGTTPGQRWTKMVNNKYSLQWHKDFAARHGKPMTFPEWGVSTRKNDSLGGGDNPYFITKMMEWFSNSPTLYAAYFEYNTPTNNHRLMPVNGTMEFPKASVEYRRIVNGTPSPPPPPPPPDPPPWWLKWWDWLWG